MPSLPSMPAMPPVAPGTMTPGLPVPPVPPFALAGVVQVAVTGAPLPMGPSCLRSLGAWEPSSLRLR